MLDLIRRQLSHLRWQIVTSQLLAIGVVIIFLMLLTRTIFINIIPTGIEPLLANLTQSAGPEEIQQAQNDLMVTFRNVVIFSILVAAVGASIIGWGVSLVLSRLILNPLQRLSSSSRRMGKTKTNIHHIKHYTLYRGIQRNRDGTIHNKQQCEDQ